MRNICESQLLKRCPKPAPGKREREAIREKREREREMKRQFSMQLGTFRWLYCSPATMRAQEPTGCESQTHAGFLPRKANSSGSNVFMHAKSDPFHPPPPPPAAPPPRPRARWQRSSVESPLSSTGSLRGRQATMGGRVEWREAKVKVQFPLSLFFFLKPHGHILVTQESATEKTGGEKHLGFNPPPLQFQMSSRLLITNAARVKPQLVRFPFV